ncbi:polysaccharide biosynthesis/export family protein [Beijerinckia sp. L45]|uniref:polysaccharide biosynthesis/export family protein n=1 Tax=Beijerinckia sp. L45 TaxID=1641855 RepID=UPI00131DECB5|nr:polysaccharide biosynthesis/export family protein [Beijerinckia sp. L45]
MIKIDRSAPIALLSFAAFTLAAVLPASAEYRLGSGDVVELAVFGVADFKRRATVNVDGDISVPFLGEVHAAGLTLDGLRKTLADDLAKTGTMRSPDVTLELAEYRPFFIGGDVARPGAIAYRPGLTVRHAVALAGGYDALRFRAENPLLSGPEFRSQYESLWADLVRHEARRISLQAEIDGKTAIDMDTLDKAPLDPNIIREIADLERADLKLRIAARGRDLAFLTKSFAQTKADVAALEVAIADQTAAITQQLAAAGRTRDGQLRGIIAAARVDEDSRSLAVLRSQQVEATSRLAQATKERDDLGKRIDGFADDYRAKVGRELQEVVVELEKGRSQIRSAGEKLIYTGALKAQLRGEAAGPQIVIYRTVDATKTRIDAAADADVLPDDMIEIVIRPEQMVVAPVR